MKHYETQIAVVHWSR